MSHGRALPRYESLQPRYNLYDREGFEEELRDLCVQNEVSVICLSALAKGFLTGKYQSAAAISRSEWKDRLTQYQTDRGFRILNQVGAIAEARGTSGAAVSLAWLMAQPGVTAPIAAANTIEQLEEVMNAARLILTPGEIAALSLVSGPDLPTAA